MPTSTSALPGTTILNLPVAITLDGSEEVPIVQGGTTKRANVQQIVAEAISSGAPLTVPYGGTGLSSFVPYQVVTGGVVSSASLQQVTAGTSGYLLTYGTSITLPSWQPHPVVSVSSGAIGQMAYFNSTNTITGSSAIRNPSSAPNLGAMLIATSTSLDGVTSWKPPLVVDVSLYPTVQAAADVAMTAQGSILWCSTIHALSSGPVGLNLNGATYLRLSGGGNLTYTGSGTAVSLNGTFDVEIDHLRFLTLQPESIFRLSTGSQNSNIHIHDCYLNVTNTSSTTIGIDAPGSQDLFVERNYFVIPGGTGIRLTLDDASRFSVNPLIEKNNFNQLTRVWVYSPSDITTIRNNTGQITPGHAILCPSTAGRPAQSIIFEGNWIGDYTSTSGGADIVISNAQVTISRGNFYANFGNFVSITQLSCTGMLLSDGDAFTGNFAININTNNGLSLRATDLTSATVGVTGTPSYTASVSAVYGRQNIYGVQSFSSYGSTGAVPTGVFLAINRSTSPLKDPTVGSAVTTTVPIQMAADGSVGMSIDAYGTGVSPNLITRSARGTQGAPLPLQANDALFNLVGLGYGSTQAAYISSGWSAFGLLLNGVALENWSSASMGSAWDFYTISSGGITVSNKMRLGRGLMVGTTSDPGVGNIRAAGSFYSAPPVLLTGLSGSVTNVQSSVVINSSGTFTLTLPPSSLNSGMWMNVTQRATFAVNSTGNIMLQPTSSVPNAVICSSFGGRTVNLQADGAGLWYVMGF